jgi:hypothetical protein
MDYSNLEKVKVYIRDSQGIQSKEKIKAELVENFNVISEKEFEEIYDSVVQSLKLSTQGWNFFFVGLLIPILLFVGIYFAYKAKKLDKDNKSAKRLIIVSYMIFIIPILIVLFLQIFFTYQQSNGKTLTGQYLQKTTDQVLNTKIEFTSLNSSGYLRISQYHSGQSGNPEVKFYSNIETENVFYSISEINKYGENNFTNTFNNICSGFFSLTESYNNIQLDNCSLKSNEKYNLSIQGTKLNYSDSILVK